jgi:copper chaperone CopZ
VVLALSVPLYVCATASVPIAAALVGAGMPMGAALVFLMAGPATNVATIGAIYRGFGAKVAGIYLGTIVVGSAGLGLAFDALFDARGAVGLHAHAHEAWWAVASAVALLGLIAWFAVEDARAWWGRRAAARARGARLEIAVEGMTCEGCSGRLQRVLGAAEGVESAAVSLEEGKAVLTGPISEAAARALITQAGFKPA